MNMHWVTRVPQIGPAYKVLRLGAKPGIQVAVVRYSHTPSTEGKYVGRVDLPGLANQYHHDDDEKTVMISCMGTVEAWVKKAGLGGGA